ncbi:MAG: hypothetical protein ABJ081_04470 [Hyphomicrobiales bacterium]
MRSIYFPILGVLFLVACSGQETSNTKTAKKYEAKEGKICFANDTDNEIYFVLSESGQGKMRGNSRPGSKTCTGSFSNASLTVSVEKRGTEYCNIQAVSGKVYVLKELNIDSDCKWQ